MKVTKLQIEDISIKDIEIVVKNVLPLKMPDLDDFIGEFWKLFKEEITAIQKKRANRP